jgi:hypothetical protein
VQQDPNNSLSFEYVFLSPVVLLPTLSDVQSDGEVAFPKIKGHFHLLLEYPGCSEDKGCKHYHSGQ